MGRSTQNKHTKKKQQKNIQTNKQKETKPFISIIFKINTEDLRLNHLVTCSMFFLYNIDSDEISIEQLGMNGFIEWFY